MTIWLVCAYDWDGTQRIWGFTTEADAWNFASMEEKATPKYSYSVEPLTLDSKEYV